MGEVKIAKTKTIQEAHALGLKLWHQDIQYEIRKKKKFRIFVDAADEKAALLVILKARKNV